MLYNTNLSDKTIKHHETISRENWFATSACTKHAHRTPFDVNNDKILRENSIPFSFRFHTNFPMAIKKNRSTIASNWRRNEGIDRTNEIITQPANEPFDPQMTFARRVWGLFFYYIIPSHPTFLRGKLAVWHSNLVRDMYYVMWNY